MRLATSLLSIAITATITPKLSASEGWNRFRGPNGSGVAQASRPPIKLGEETTAWKVPVPAGLSSPVVSGSRLFLTGFEDGRLVTLAFDKATGRRLWSRKAPEVSIEKVHQANGPATPTPLIDENRLFVRFGSFGLLSYDHEGRELWRKPLPLTQSLYGSSTSPIGYEDKVILVLDDDANLPQSRVSRSKILAVHKATGETAWETPRPFHRSGWSTPMIWSYGKRKELVVLGNGVLRGYALPTGEETWFVRGFSRETIATPVQGAGLLFASGSKLGGAADLQPDPLPFWKAVISFDANGDDKLARKEMTEPFTFPFRPELPPGHPGYGMPLPKDKKQRERKLDGMFRWMDKNQDGFWTEKEFLANLRIGHGKPLLVAVRPGGKGDATETHVEWELNRGLPEVPSPLFHRDRIYMVRSGGVLTAVDAKTGTMLYRERLGGFGQYVSSPVIARNHLYLASEIGLVSVVPTGESFEIAHQYDLKATIEATPALDEDTLYLRTKSHLHAFRQKE